jgi:SpoVK/Ycf46/Vps4 family AAA+-type ATPase
VQVVLSLAKKPCGKKHLISFDVPGTGKTMLAKAIAKESHATFVNVSLSSIMNKWFGESNKLISATFNLARKLAPSVVFIDEMDSFLSQRDSTEGSAVNSMKSEFLTLWDGLLSEKKYGDDSEEAPVLPSPPIIVLGATNRPYDVDPAILRRLPRSFEIALPNYDSRLQLLNLFLQRQSMTKEAKQYVTTVAKQTEGYSGSDLKEVCRAAAWEPVRELTSGASRKAVGCATDNTNRANSLKRTSSGFPPRGTKARPVDVNDFILALQKVKKTGDSAREFHKKEFIRGRKDRAAMAAEINKMNGKAPQQPVQVNMNQLIAAAVAAISNTQNGDSNVNGQEDEDSNDSDGPPEIFVDATNGLN